MLLRLGFKTTIVALLLMGASGSAEQHARDALLADRVVVIKKQRSMMLMKRGRVLKTYKIGANSGKVGGRMEG